jgi:hypothetical protein
VIGSIVMVMLYLVVLARLGGVASCVRVRAQPVPDAHPLGLARQRGDRRESLPSADLSSSPRVRRRVASNAPRIEAVPAALTSR